MPGFFGDDGTCVAQVIGQVEGQAVRQASVHVLAGGTLPKKSFRGKVCVRLNTAPGVLEHSGEEGMSCAGVH